MGKNAKVLKRTCGLLSLYFPPSSRPGASMPSSSFTISQQSTASFSSTLCMCIDNYLSPSTFCQWPGAAGILSRRGFCPSRHSFAACMFLQGTSPFTDLHSRALFITSERCNYLGFAIVCYHVPFLCHSLPLSLCHLSRSRSLPLSVTR